MLIQEVEVTTDSAEWLRSNTPEPAAARLRHALDYHLVQLRFSDEEADQVLAALIDPPPGLEGLRAALLHEREHRSI
jgi:hypothetical protein